MVLPKVAKIAVEQAALHFDKLYDYYIPESLGELKRGCRVIVPFGGGNRKRQGIIVGYDVVPNVSKLKPVFSVYDKQPLLNDEMMDLALWMKERTFCSVFDAVRAMLPTGFYLKIKPVYKAAECDKNIIDGLTGEERAIFDCVVGYTDGIDRDRLLTKLGLTLDNDLPDRMSRSGLLIRSDDAFRNVGDATVRMVKLTAEGEELSEAVATSSCTQKQKKVIDLLTEVGCASIREIGYFCSVTSAVVTALEKKGLVECYDNEVLRTPFTQNLKPEIESVLLNEQQQRAFDELYRLYKTGKPSASLLYGVTGSGKTEVYMNLIDRVIKDGKHVIVLVPEISLTPQMLHIFLGRYGSRVAVQHSGLAIGERMDEWKRIKRGEAQITVGTRSAVFAPVENLGLIIMDEEQEHTYKSESSPRYHARDVARYRCAKQNAMLLLTSATPSVETYHAALTGRYAFQKLTSRYGEARLPEVEVVDMRQQSEAVAGGIVSERLKEEIDNTLEQGRQVILLLNRRGFHTFVSCRSCGHVISCPSCSISLTYHRTNGRLMCHYCGHSQEPVSQCPECTSSKIRYSGLGTQRAEQELEQLFPSASILRMDTDVTMSRFAYEKNFSRFAKGEYNLMIGTQMVAKGLDFPNVGLVGVLSADQSLYGGDFRSFENTFALLTQVVGRAGRREIEGKALIQTFTPENYVIELASQQDYEGFFETEIAARKMMLYPPYTDLCMFGFSGIDEKSVQQAAFRFLKMLKHTVTNEYKQLPVIVLDPTPAVVARVAGKYRYKLIMKTRNNALMREMTFRLISEFSKASENKSISLFVDINPVGIM
ncbi:MAG: primosomal protein N' [Oscillospiraceae bacterium]|nr:primosomal protein N' [Oscillospiraceae bacterium]MDD4413894.1 primosomal protein N' [Oscillospiraceae bacterium]